LELGWIDWLDGWSFVQGFVDFFFDFVQVRLMVAVVVSLG